MRGTDKKKGVGNGVNKQTEGVTAKGEGKQCCQFSDFVVRFTVFWRIWQLLAFPRAAD